MRKSATVVALAALAAAGILSSCSKAPAPAEAPKAPEAPAAPAAPAAAAAPSGNDTKALFETKCSTCHQVDRATSRKETKEGWTALVKRMQAKQPGLISDDEAAKIVDFLTSNHGK